MKMYCTLGFKYTIKDYIDFDKLHNGEIFNFLGFEFEPQKNKQGKYAYWSCKTESFYMKILGDQLYIDVSSLHKFAKGNNYDRFTLTEVKEAVNSICSIFSIEAKETKLTELAPALNLALEDSDEVNRIYSSFNTLNGKPFLFSYKRSGSSIYGKKLQLTDYSTKGYNKNTVCQLTKSEVPSGNIFRFEKEYKDLGCLKSRKTIPINIKSLADLYDYNIIEQFGDDLINTFRTIIKYVNKELLEIKDFRRAACFEAPHLIEEYRSLFPDSYKKERKWYNKVSKIHNQKLNDYIEKKMIVEISHILNN